MPTFVGNHAALCDPPRRFRSRQPTGPSKMGERPPGSYLRPPSPSKMGECPFGEEPPAEVGITSPSGRFQSARWREAWASGCRPGRTIHPVQPIRRPAADPVETGLCARETLLRGLKTHSLTLSPSHSLTVSLSHRLTLSPSHCLTVSLSHRLTLPLFLRVLCVSGVRFS